MNHKHFKQILISNNIIPKTISDTKLGLKLVKQKEKFILEDAAKAIIYNKKITPINGKYTLKQYMHEIQNITNQYYLLYIQLSQLEAFLRTFVNHKMIKIHGNQWHKQSIMNDLNDFQNSSIQNLAKPSYALNSISFGTLELVFLNGSRYATVFEKYIKKNKILTKANKPKYSNKKEIKALFSIIRNVRNDICHHRRIGESIKSNTKYTKKKMTKSEVITALKDLKTLLGYENIFDVKSIQIQY